MHTITVFGLQLQFDGDSDIPPLQQAQKLLNEINEAIGPVDGNPCLLGIDGLEPNQVHAEPLNDADEDECESVPSEAWKRAVMAGETTLGYWEWVWSNYRASPDAGI